MKLLIGASPSKFFHMKEFSENLEKLDIANAATTPRIAIVTTNSIKVKPCGPA